MQNRAQESPYKQVLSSLEFHLVRAKLRAAMGTPQEALKDFETLVRERKFISAPAARYGLVLAHLRAKDLNAAQREMDALTALKVASPMIAGAAIIKGQNDSARSSNRSPLLNTPRLIVNR